jgi:hypothetical protein
MKLDILNNTKYKIFVAGILIIILAVLFYFYRKNVLNNTGPQSEFSVKTVKTLSPEELKRILPAGIDSIAAEFGIKKEWIKEQDEAPSPDKDKKSKTDKTRKPPSPPKVFLWFSKFMYIPKDVPASELNLEIRNFLSEYDFDCTGNEEPKTGNLTLTIFNNKDSAKKKIAGIDIIYSDKLKRDAADICLIFNRVEDIPLNQLEKILLSPEKFSVVLPDIVEKIDAQTVVLDSKRDYVLFFDIGNEDDLLAEFKSDMRDKEWKSKVRSICYEYDKAAGVFILNPRKIHPLEFDLLKEFSLYNLNSYKDTLLIKFASDEKDRKKTEALFRDITSRTEKGARSMIYLVNFTQEEFDFYRQDLLKLKRKGYRFYNFTEIMKKRRNASEQEEKVIITG